MLNEGMFSSATDNWATPPDFFARYAQHFNFTLDVCASPDNAKCPRYFTKEVDGLAQDWRAAAGEGAIWMNPPYGRTIKDWVRKAAETAGVGGNTVVCLLPARTDTAWWHDYVMPVLRGLRPGRVDFVRGRLKFGGSKNSAPFPSAVVVFYGIRRDHG